MHVFFLITENKRIYDRAALKHWRKACSKTEKTSQDYLWFVCLLAGMGIHNVLNVDSPTQVSNGFALAKILKVTEHQPQRISVPITDRFTMRHIKLYNKTMITTVEALSPGGANPLKPDNEGYKSKHVT